MPYATERCSDAKTRASARPYASPAVRDDLFLSFQSFQTRHSVTSTATSAVTCCGSTSEHCRIEGAPELALNGGRNVGTCGSDMLNVSIATLIAFVGSAWLSIAPQPGRAEVAYDLQPLMAGGNLSAVQVTVQLRGGSDGRTVLELPDHFAGEKERWRRLYLYVSGTQTHPSLFAVGNAEDYQLL